jgi:hypothetical protein
MASRRTIARKTSGKGKKLTRAALEKLLKKAQAEVANLLKDHRDGTLTQVELKAGLQEIQEYLKAMEPHDWYSPQK